MTSIEYDICDTQGMIYRYAADQGYDIETFSALYLCSDFCYRAMDSSYSRFQMEEPEECWDFIYPEIGGFLKKLSDGSFDGDVAEWIGFTYRQLAFVTGKISRELAGIIPFRRMCAVYPGLHTVDEEMAADMLIEGLQSRGLL